jgi:hypothetical protein
MNKLAFLQNKSGSTESRIVFVMKEDVIESNEEDLKSFENMVTQIRFAFNTQHLGKDLISIL